MNHAVKTLLLAYALALAAAKLDVAHRDRAAWQDAPTAAAPCRPTSRDYRITSSSGSACASR